MGFDTIEINLVLIVKARVFQSFLVCMSGPFFGPLDRWNLWGNGAETC